MEGLKKLFSSRKFLGALIGAAVIFFEASYFADHPQMLEILVSTASLFGIQVVGQAHSDANDDSYGLKDKDDK